MIAEANTKPGVIGVNNTAEDFFSSHFLNRTFDKILMCGSVSFFTDPKAVFAGVKERLSEQGGICVITAVVSICPLFQALKQHFGSGYLKCWEHLYKLFDNIGLKFKVLNASESYSLPKLDWYTMMRKKFLTSLENLTDTTIEEGILELEKEYHDCEVIGVEVKFKIVILTK